MDGLKRGIGWLVRRKWWLPCLSVVSATFIVAAARSWEMRKDRGGVLIAAHDLDKGGRFDRSDFNLNPSAELTSNTVTDRDVLRLEGAVYGKSIRQGEPLTFDRLTAKASLWKGTIPRGHRAYGIAPENPWLAKAGDRIDIWLRPESSDNAPFVVVAGVLVMDRVQSGRVAELLVAVRQRELELLEKARQQGKLSIALLGETEPEAGHDARGARRDGHRSRRARRPPTIQIVTDGR